MGEKSHVRLSKSITDVKVEEDYVKKDDETTWRYFQRKDLLSLKYFFKKKYFRGNFKTKKQA